MNLRDWMQRLTMPLLLLGVAVVVAGLLMRSSPEVQATAAGDAARIVRYLPAEPEDLRAELRGFGNIKPASTWTAVAQVTGVVTYKYEHLETGQPIVRGTVLLRIDDSDYQLVLKQYEAAQAEAKHALLRLEQEEENLSRELTIVNDQLRLAEADLQRARDAQSRGGVSQSDLDMREQAVLAHRANQQANQNALDLIEPRRAQQQAGLEAATAAIDQAKLDIQRCTIRAPFDSRVRRVEVEESRNVKVGEEMLELFSVDAAELHCQVTLDDLKHWLPEELMSPLESGMLNHPWETKDGPIEGEVVLAGTRQDIRWEGKLDRFLGELDPFTRMLTVVIRVDGPYENLGRAERPPLVEGMFCEGVLHGRLHEKVFRIPARSIREGKVMLMNAVGELELRPVSVRFEQGEMAVVDEGLVTGDRVIVTDLFPAVPGMKLRGEPAQLASLAEAQP
jgi:multidrug efflux pump subunit AcrA (membrane-fusion protein)